MIGVVRAPVAIINFVPNLCRNISEFVQDSIRRRPRTKNAKLIIATGARTTPIIDHGKVKF